MLQKSNIKETKFKTKDFNLDKELTVLDNLEAEGKIKNIGQKIFCQDQNSNTSIISNKTLRNFNHTNWIADINSEN